MNLAIVNCTYESFTPGHSGAICTWIYEMCRVAEADGVRPLLITRTSRNPPYHRPGTIWLDYPTLPTHPLVAKMLGLHKRMNGWVRPRQEAYHAKIAAAIEQAGVRDWPILLHNDMELAVSLRRRFPSLSILHLAHNLNGTTRQYRRDFGKSVNVAMAVSDYATHWNADFYGLDRGAIQRLYNGVDLDAFVPRQHPDTVRPVISFAGRLDRDKGPDVLLKAALRLSERTKNFAVQVLGRNLYDKDETDDYVAGVHRLGEALADRKIRCDFPGWVNRKNLPEKLAAAHIHVTPSRWDEPFGLTTLEGMACGMATIGSRTGGTPEIIGDAGFLFEREDDAALADLLEPLVRDASLRAEYGRRARARAELFSWRHTWTRLKEILVAGGLMS